MIVRFKPPSKVDFLLKKFYSKPTFRTFFTGKIVINTSLYNMEELTEREYQEAQEKLREKGWKLATYPGRRGTNYIINRVYTTNSVKH